MTWRPRSERLIKSLTVFTCSACGVGAAVGLFVVLVRVPALAETKRDLLFGTLVGVTVSLLFAVAALLVHLTYQVYRLARRSVGPATITEGAIPGRS